MIESKEKPIKGLKIKYDGKTYENITYFSISNWDSNERVSFTEKKIIQYQQLLIANILI